tara:strand:+ start:2259 stop:2567 length:309 start_codon:yes stop_codon:yes gene_type:complete
MTDTRAISRIMGAHLGDPAMGSLIDKCNQEELAALTDCIRAAYEEGGVDAEVRAGRFVSSILKPLLGISLDDQAERTEGSRRRRAVKGAIELIQGMAGRAKV